MGPGAMSEAADTAKGPSPQAAAPGRSPEPGPPRTAAGRLVANRSATFAPPAVELPRGGGSVRGIGETFASNPATGTGSMTIPLPASPARSGATPDLALGYDSGAALGVFGLGWSLGLPAVTRKTDKGLPRYDDGPDGDVFVLSGTEDLVPWIWRSTARRTA